MQHTATHCNTLQHIPVAKRHAAPGEAAALRTTAALVRVTVFDSTPTVLIGERVVAEEEVVADGEEVEGQGSTASTTRSAQVIMWQ